MGSHRGKVFLKKSTEIFQGLGRRVSGLLQGVMHMALSVLLELCDFAGSLVTYC